MVHYLLFPINSSFSWLGLLRMRSMFFVLLYELLNAEFNLQMQQNSD